MFNADHLHVIRCSIYSNFRNNKKADTFSSFRGICGACQQKMDDVFRHIMVTVCDKLFCTFYQVVSSFLFCCTGGSIADCTSGLRFCQTHRSGPLAAEHFFAKGVFLFFWTKSVNQVCRTGCEWCADGKCLVCRQLGFFSNDRNNFRKSLSSIFGRHIHAQPTTLAKLFPGICKTIWSYHRAIFYSTTLAVSIFVEGAKYLFWKSTGLVDNHRKHLFVKFSKVRKFT